jgi:hypothetical protein
MAIFATHARLLLVNGVVVVDGLVFGGIENLWKYNPTNKQATSQASYKEDPTN